MRGDDHIVAFEQGVLGERLGGKTSRAAPATRPDSSPAWTASRSTSSPRAQLTIRTPSRICSIAAASIQCTVSGSSAGS